MKVLALGGAGAVCQHSVRDRVAFSDFSEIVIGEYNVAAAETLAAEIDDPRLTVREINAEIYDDLVTAFKGFDVIINGLDVSTEEDQWSYDAAARGKGLTFVPE